MQEKYTHKVRYIFLSLGLLINEDYFSSDWLYHETFNMFSILLIRLTKYEIVLNRSQLYNYEAFINFQIIVALSQLKERVNL